MPVLVLAEHDHRSLKSATLNALSAAQKLGGEVHVLVAGNDAGGAADAAAKVVGVAKVLLADAPQLAYPTAEAVAGVLLSLANSGSYTHFVAPATGFGKNVMPRVPALSGRNTVRVMRRSCRFQNRTELRSSTSPRFPM